MRELTSLSKKVFYYLLLAWGLMIIYIASTYPLHPSLQGYLFAMPVFILCFMAYPARERKQRQGAPSNPSGLDVLLVTLSICSSIYPLFRYNYWMVHAASETSLDVIFSGVFLGLVLEATRRSTGKVIPIICLLMLIYTSLGQFIPGMWSHPPMDASWVLGGLYTTTTGYVGSVTWIISTVVCIYVLSGSILFKCGVGESSIDISKLLAGRIRGGAGLLSVFAAGFFGMISGSPVANVATCGPFTIPLMKKYGYSPDFAGAVMCASSTGGQIMPPVMGVGAFIMAEMLGIPYVKVVVAAILPAVLYFSGVGVAVYFESRKCGIPILPKNEIPTMRSVLSWRKIGPLGFFIGVLLYLLFDGHSAQGSCFWALIALVGIFVFSTGKLTSTDIKQRSKLVIAGLVEGAQHLVSLGSLILCVQVLVSLMSVTGVGVKFSELLLTFTGQQILLSLAMTGIVCTALGLGLPTTAAYLIGISVLGTGLRKLGVDPLAAHLFIFYYAILSEVTPPVSLSAMVAAGIAKGNFLRIGWLAWRLALPAFIIPFMFTLNPALLLKGHITFEVIQVVIRVSISLIFVAAGLEGFLFRPAKYLERIGMLATAAFLLYPSIIMNLVGSGGTILLIGTQVTFKHRLV